MLWHILNHLFDVHFYRDVLKVLIDSFCENIFQVSDFTFARTLEIFVLN